MTQRDLPHHMTEPRVVALGHPSLDRIVDTFCDALACEPGGSSPTSDQLRDQNSLRLGLVIGQRLAAVFIASRDGRATMTTLRRWRGTGVDRQLLTAGIGRFRTLTSAAPVFSDAQLDRPLISLARATGADVRADREVPDLVPV